MIYFLYIIVAIGVVYCSNKASYYVDLIDKKTSLSGAFIGGVMLSAVTSLPELFTSISSTLILDKPGLSIGNVLGSNLFNMAVLAVFMLIYYKSFSKARIAKSHFAVTIAVAIIYIVLLLNMVKILNLEFFTVNITSIIIIALYIIGIKNMSDDNEQSKSDNDDNSKLSVKQIGIRFALASIGIIALSVAITYLTDGIAAELNLGTGIAGALFLGIATSLPELSSTIVLFRIKNYNIAIGNIIGSNIFNLFILAFVDLFYIGRGVYDYSDPKTVNLLVFGAIAMPLLLILLRYKGKITQIVCPVLLVGCYAAALAL